jgi:hypothetical protein
MRGNAVITAAKTSGAEPTTTKLSRSVPPPERSDGRRSRCGALAYLKPGSRNCQARQRNEPPRVTRFGALPAAPGSLGFVAGLRTLWIDDRPLPCLLDEVIGAVCGAPSGPSITRRFLARATARSDHAMRPTEYRTKGGIRDERM